VPDAETEMRDTIYELRLAVATLTNSVTSLQNTVANSVSGDRVHALEEKVKSLEVWRDWAIKIVLTAVAMAVLSLVFVQTGAIK